MGSIGQVLRVNELGFADIKLKVVNTDFFKFVSNVKNEFGFEKIDINTYGKYNYLSIEPNDDDINEQWYLDKIEMKRAWEMVTGSTCITVGVLDSGVDWTHDDIGEGGDTFQNIWLNPSEDVWSDPTDPTTGNNIDDDGDGLIDNWKGWNFANNNNDSRTINQHGTFVAGILAAKTNNNIGIAGIAGGFNSSGVNLLPLCIGVNAPDAAVLDDAILHAVDKGVKVIQISASIGQTMAIDNAIEHAIDNDVVVVCAAGNDNSDLNYPANNENVISVGATTQSDQKTNFSNFGDDLIISAPGQQIYSTILNDNYDVDDGTSYSAPQVSGVAALLLSIDSNLTPQEIEDILTSTADKVGGYNYSNGRSDELGFGRLNAYEAIKSIMPNISGGSYLCSSQEYILNNYSSEFSLDWEATPTGIVNISENGNTATLTPTGTGEITLTATISSSCDSIEVSKTIWAGEPDHTQFRVYQDPYCHNSNIAFGAYYGSSFDSCSLLDMGVTDIEWEVISSYGTQVSNNIGPGVCSTTNNNSGIQVYFSNTTDPQFVRFRAKNDCGWSDWLQQPLYVNFQACNPWGMMVSPNPADTYFEVTFEDTNSLKNSEIKTDFTGTIYNQNGVRLRNSRSKNGILRMNTNGLSEGIYFLHVQRGAEVIKKQIIVSH